MEPTAPISAAPQAPGDRGALAPLGSQIGFAKSYQSRLLPVIPSTNISQTSGSNAAQTYTLTPKAGQRVVLYFMEAYTSAGGSTFSIESPSGTVVYQGQTAGAISTTPWYYEPATPRVFGTGVAVLFKLTAAGAGNTSTINLHVGVLLP